MNKKAILITIILILMFIAFRLAFSSKNIEDSYTMCISNEKEGKLDKEIIYKIYKDNTCDDCIKTISIKTTYNSETSNNDNLNTLAYIIDTENNEYSSNKGFTYKVNSRTSNKYVYTINFDIKEISNELKSLYNLDDSYKNELNYLKENNYTCK